MPLRRVVLSNGREVSRNIRDIHPNGEEFLPEEFTIQFDNGERSLRIYDLLSEIVGNIAASQIGEEETGGGSAEISD